jgi:hypothetical protein
MTLDELAAALAPVADEALAEHIDPNVVKAGTVLAALMGAIAGGGAVDLAVLDALAIHAGLICEHRNGMHDQRGGDDPAHDSTACRRECPSVPECPKTLRDTQRRAGRPAL